MSHTPHELAEDFPEYAQRISALQITDTHFERLTGEYHEVNRAIHRAETDVEPTSDAHLTEMRKSRVELKDQIYRYLIGN